MEALISQKISTLVYGQVTDDLTALNNTLTDNMQAAQSGDMEATQIQWIATTTFFEQAIPHVSAVIVCVVSGIILLTSKKTKSKEGKAIR